MADQNPHSRVERARTYPRRNKWRRAGRWTARDGRAWSGKRPVYGALDLGTNNCRMLIASPQKDGFRIFDAFSHMVRLGEGVEQNGIISEAATMRAVEALKICAEKMDRRKVTLMRSVGTEALRMAENAGEFIDHIWNETGLAIDIISPREEARLVMLGCQGLMEPELDHSLVFDIGGGSTETVFVQNTKGKAGGDGEENRSVTAKMLDWLSVPYGVVRLSERLGAGGLEPGKFDELKAEIIRSIAAFTSRIDISRRVTDGKIQLLGSSGTITTLAGLELGLPAYDRSIVDGARIRTESLARLAREVALADHETRVGLACIGEERADLIVPGCVILCALLEIWPGEYITVADRGIREGILRAMIESEAHVGLSEGKAS